MDTRTAIRDFIFEAFPLSQSAPDFSDDTDLFFMRIVRSDGVTELLDFLFDTYGLIVPEEDRTVDNFRSVSAIDSYLSGKLVGSRQ